MYPLNVRTVLEVYTNIFVAANSRRTADVVITNSDQLLDIILEVNSRKSQSAEQVENIFGMCASEDKASRELGLELVKTVDYTKHYKQVINFIYPYIKGRNKCGNCQSIDPKIGNLINVLLRILEVVKDKGGYAQ